LARADDDAFLASEVRTSRRAQRAHSDARHGWQRRPVGAPGRRRWCLLIGTHYRPSMQLARPSEAIDRPGQSTPAHRARRGSDTNDPTHQRIHQRLRDRRLRSWPTRCPILTSYRRACRRGTQSVLQRTRAFIIRPLVRRIAFAPSPDYAPFGGSNAASSAALISAIRPSLTMHRPTATNVRQFSLQPHELNADLSSFDRNGLRSQRSIYRKI
jgi:hypothetical protein